MSEPSGPARRRRRRPRAPSSETARGWSTSSAARGSAPWSRRTATATARSSARGRRLPAARPGSRSPRPRRRPSCGAISRARRILDDGRADRGGAGPRARGRLRPGRVARGLRRRWPPSAGRRSASGRGSTSSTTRGMGRLGERDPDAVLALVDRVAADERLELAGVWTHFATADEPRLGLLRRAARALRAAGRAGARRAPRRAGARRQQRRDAAGPGLPLRHGSLRDRDLRPRPVPAPTPSGGASSRRSSCAPTSPTSSASRPGPAPATAGAGARPPTPGWGCCRSATATAFAAGSPTTREVAGRRHALSARRHDLDGQRHGRPRARDRQSSPASPAVLIGAQGDERILCEEVAGALDTINYEITCGISAAGAARARRLARAGERPDRRAAWRALRPCGPAREALGAARAAPGSSAARSATRPSGGEVTDLDLAVAGDDAGGGRSAIGRVAGGPAFQLSAEFATWRVLARGRRLARRRQPGCAATAIEADLGAPRLHGQRDRGPAGRSRRRRRSTRTGGLADLEARLLRAVVRAQLRRRPAADPARRPDRRGPRARDRPETVALARAEAAARGRAGGRAPVRRAAPAAHRRRPAAGPRAARRARGDAVRPARARGAPRRRAEPQPPPRRPRPHDRGAAAAARGGGRPRDASPGERRGRAVGQLLAEPLADELTRGGALRFAALFHDLGKPATRSRASGGWVLFIGHDRAGARDRRRALLAAASEPPARRLPRQPDPQPPAARLPGPRAAAVAAPRLRVPARHRPGLGRRDPADGRRPARRPRASAPGRRRSTPTSSWPAR